MQMKASLLKPESYFKKMRQTDLKDTLWRVKFKWRKTKGVTISLSNATKIWTKSFEMVAYIAKYISYR